MNENFKLALEKSGMTMYVLAKKSGVPYTVINELVNDKKDMNTRHAVTVAKLAAALDAPITSLLNPFSVMDRVEGIYKNVRYKWKKDDTMTITLKDGKNKRVIRTNHKLEDITKKDYYEDIPKFEIENLLEEKEFQKKVRELSWRITDE